MSSMRMLLALAASAALAVAGCRAGDAPADNDAVAASPANDATPAKELALPQPALDRAAFLKAMASAASARTTGAKDGLARQLDGRRFAIRVRFGCDGPAPATSTSALRWTHEKGGKSFGLYAKPDVSLADEPLKNISNQTIEAVEGFWIPRPWQVEDACPEGQASDDEAVLPAPQLVGIAQYFTSEDSRVGRRSGRPYVATQTIEVPEELPRTGLILLLEGRFDAWPNGAVILCTGSGRNRQPTCIASAHLDRAAFLRPEDGSVIAEWRE